MAIYGKDREKWNPIKIKAKTSKNKTYSLTSSSVTITGTSVTANPDSDNTSEGSQDLDQWYYFSGNAANGNNTAEDPKQPSSAVPVDGGTSYANEIYAFTGGGAERIIASKTSVSGTVTVSFKIIECGGGGSAVPARIYNPDGGTSGNAMGGASSARDWLGGSGDQYDPIQLVTTTSSPPGGQTNNTWSATWTAVALTDIHGHGGSHPNASTANIDRTEFKIFTFTITVPPNSYIGIRQDVKAGTSNSWALADLSIVTSDIDVMAFDLKKTMWTYLSMGDSIKWVTVKKEESSLDQDHEYHLTKYDIDNAYSTGDLSPSKIKIGKSRFCNALNFDNALISNSDQSAENYIREDLYAQYTPRQLFGSTGTYAQPGPRNIFFSFWIKTNSDSANNDGHAFAQWGQYGSLDRDIPAQLVPRIGFFIDDSGRACIRFCEHFGQSNDISPTASAGQKYMNITSSTALIEVTSPAAAIVPGAWHHVVFGLKFTSGWDEAEAKSNTEVWIDGIKKSASRYREPSTGGFLKLNEDETRHEWQFGSLVNGLGSRSGGTTPSNLSTSVDLISNASIIKVTDASAVEVGATLTKVGVGGGSFSAASVVVTVVNTGTTPHQITVSTQHNSAGAITFSIANPDTIKRSSGFSGALGEFVVTTQDLADASARDEYAKFLYEASREGSFQLHSGIHSASPRIEQLDLDNDSAYPPNHSMPVFTIFDRNSYFGYDIDNADSDNNEATGIEIRTVPDARVSLRSTEKFTEGYNASDAGYEWKENASQYFIDSSTVMPHLKLNPSDTILTNGNWYSDSRSEIFADDLHATTGFVVNPANDVATTKHYGQTSDELYREHYSTDKVLPFIDAAIPFVSSSIPNDPKGIFDDCFVIEIPIPVPTISGTSGGSCTLSTNSKELNSSNSAEKAEYRFNGATGTFQDSGQKINTMAYYNFKEKKWEHTVPSYGTYDNLGVSLKWTGIADIGFNPMSGLVFPKSGKLLPFIADLYGRPNTDFGFPVHRKFESKSGQTIDMSKYIDKAVILEGWEMYTKVVPRVGYQHNSSGVVETTTTSPQSLYDGETDYTKIQAGKNSLHYGADGSACVFWDPDNSESIPFMEKEFNNSGNTKTYRYDNTVPVSSFVTSSSGVVSESSPTAESVGLVTKGVTAFLLKETDIYDKTNQRNKWLRSQPRYIAGNANNTNNSIAYSASRTYAFTGALADYSVQTDGQIDSEHPVTGIYAGRFPPLSYDFYEPKFPASSPAGRYTRGSSRELIGYLQHVYHNDENPTANRSIWQREDNRTYYGIRPQYRGEKNIISHIEKENQTYISNLLRENTSEYAFHVSGSMKSITPYEGSMPISNFKIAGSSATKLGVYQHETIDASDASMIDLYQSYSVIPSAEGSTFSEFVQHDAVPNIIGKTKSLTVQLPEGFYPSRLPTTASRKSHWKETALSPFEVSVAAEPRTDVILKPSDKLVLGIQDSISTTFASQQMQCNTDITKADDDYKFVNWGRNYLKIPEQSDAYLRLYIRKTREDKKFNVVSDESRYNHNVNRDLGDHMIDDTFILDAPLMYTGSMADDIMGPTTFTPPLMDINIAVQSSIKDSQALVATSFAYDDGGSAFWQITRNGGFGHNMFTSTDGNVAANTNAHHTPLNWGSCSAQLFKNRSQPGSDPKRPAITWHDPAGFDKNNAVAPTTSGAHWANINEALHWVITKRRDNTAIEANDFPWDNSDSSLYGADARPPYRNQPVCVIEELNPRLNSSTTGLVVTTISGGSDAVKNGTIDKTIAGYDSPGYSAWNLQVLLPVFKQTNSTYMTPTIGGVFVDFRLVKIDNRAADFADWVHASVDHRASGQRPQVTAGTELRVGDAFYYNDSNESILINLNKTAVIAAADQSADKWVRHAVGADNVVTIFIVVGEVEFYNVNLQWPRNFGYNTSATAVKNVKPLSYNSVFAIISRILDIQCEINEELLARVINPWSGEWEADKNGATSPQIPRIEKTGGTTAESVGHTTLNWYQGPQVAGFDGSFSLRLPEEPFLREAMTSYEPAINAIIDFKLCGTSLVGIDPALIGDSLDDNIWLHDAGGSIVGVPGNNLVNSAFETAGGMLGNVTQKNTYWFGDYLKAWVSTSTALTGDPTANGLGIFKSTEPSPYTNQGQPNSMYKIDYTGIVTSAPRLTIIKETYNDSVGRTIDRFVQRRTTEQTNKTDSSRPLVAGPFGSLKNHLSLHSNIIILDSMPSTSLSDIEPGYCTVGAHSDKAACEAASGTWVETNYFTLAKDIPSAFPFESSNKRSFDVRPSLVKIRMKNSSPGGRSGDNTSTIEYTEQTGNASAGTISWGYTTFSSNPYSEGSLGYLNVTNYMQEEFQGNSDFSKKTARDVLIGFGNGVSGKHLLRPSVYDYKAFTGVAPVVWSSQYIIDKPRGSRFGQYNIEKQTGSYKFSYRSFGQLRDMLEQSIDTKFINHISNERVYGAPVVISFMNSINPEVPKLAENTERYNKTVNAVVTKPYIESNYEGTPQFSRLNSEALRVDVAGSIRTSSVTAPGNIAANIRTRG